MDILIGLVIATIIITGVYVGYYAAQDAQENPAEGHSITPEISVYHDDSIQILKAKTDQTVIG